jgi:2-methylisocitrate lyase-like PEP mutase family enzyme
MPSKFESFAALHVPGDPVVLYNIWDVGSANAVVAAGATALATGSHPVADANGWPDGEQVPIEFALANAKRIGDAIEVPLTVDFEGAYSVDPAKAAVNVARLAATGAVGCNFEDQVIGGEGLHPLKEQAKRFRIDEAKIDGAIRDLVGEIVRRQGDGDYAGTKAFLDRWGAFDAEAQQVIGTMTHIPVDIRPIYPNRV